MGNGSGSGSQGSGKPPPEGPIPHVVLEASKKFRQNFHAERDQAARDLKQKADAMLAVAFLPQMRIAQMREILVMQAEYFEKYHRYEWSKHVAKGPYPADTNKCNLFVCELANATGALVPTTFTRGKYPPLAEHWANPNVRIPGWEVVTDPRPGDMAAATHWWTHRDREGNTWQTAHGGHVGLVVGNNETISHSSLKDELVRNKWGFKPEQQGQVVYRRYVGP
jgi:hypothetical protein